MTRWLALVLLLGGCATTGGSRCAVSGIGSVLAYGGGTAAAILGGLGGPFSLVGGLVAGGASLLWDGGAALACRASQPPTELDPPASDNSPGLGTN